MQSLHLVIGYTTVSSLQIEHGLVLIMAGSDAAETHGPAFGCGGHGEPVFFVIAFVFFVLAFVFFVLAFVFFGLAFVFFGLAFVFFVLALVFFGLLVGVTTTVGALVDFGSGFGIMMFITPVILGRQMSPVIMGSRARRSWASEPGCRGQSRTLAIRKLA